MCNYTRDLVWSGEVRDFVPLGHWEATPPDLGDVQSETVAGEVTRMTHRVTGISVLGENPRPGVEAAARESETAQWLTTRSNASV